MILFNNNFSSPITKTILSEYFTTVTNATNLNPMPLAGDAWNESTMAYIAGSTLVGQLVQNVQLQGGNQSLFNNGYSSCSTNPKNFQIVTEKFLRVLDKVYTKLWNESFTETGIYNTSGIGSLYTSFSLPDSSGYSNPFGIYYYVSGQQSRYFHISPSAMRFYNFVARCITAGVLDEADRLTAEDQIFISQPNTTISTSIDTVNSIITFSSNSVINIQDFNTKPGSYLNGKKLYLLMTPFIATSGILTGGKNYDPINSIYSQGYNSTQYPNGGSNGYYSPWGFFKPKTNSSKFGASIPLATHLFWRIGTPEDKEIALLEGTEVPEIIFDHLDRVSHIDTFQLKVKYGPIQFA